MGPGANPQANRTRNRVLRAAQLESKGGILMNVPLIQIPPRGVEPDSVTGCGANDIRELPVSRAAESGAVLANTGLVDPRLAEVIEAWPTIPTTIQSEILALAGINPGDANE